jgi:hypothetical protein
MECSFIAPATSKIDLRSQVGQLADNGADLHAIEMMRLAGCGAGCRLVPR